MSVKRDPRLRAFVKVDKLGQVVPGSLILRRNPPEGGRGFYWQEIVANICCAMPVSNFEFTESDGGAADAAFTITINGNTYVNTDHTLAGTYTPSPGDTVVVSVTGAGPSKTLLVVNDTSGVVLSNQVGTTGTLSYTYSAPTAQTITVVASNGPTTTTTTSTTTTSTTTV